MESIAENSTASMSPRQYAAGIIAEPDIVKRRLKLARVPQEWRALVETHVRIAWERRNAARKG